MPQNKFSREWSYVSDYEFLGNINFKQPGIEFLHVGFQTFACNFPMALLWPLFLRPLVCWIFRMIFLIKSGTGRGYSKWV